MKSYEYYKQLEKRKDIKIRVPESLKNDLKHEAEENQITMSELILQRLCQNDNTDSENNKLRRENKRLKRDLRSCQESAFQISTCVNQTTAGCKKVEECLDYIGKEMASWLSK